MTKNFKIARKPGQAAQTNAATAQVTGAGNQREQPNGEDNEPASTSPVSKREVREADGEIDLTPTRKTIEVPNHYFYQVKMRALQRRMLEKELWAEIVAEYFERHPTS